jgi:hypothetical protein
MSDASMQALAAFAESMKGMNKKELQAHKKWFSQRLKDIREHEVHLGLMQWLKDDEEAKYYLGVAAGAATGVIGMIMEEYLPSESGKKFKAVLTKEQREQYRHEMGGLPPEERITAQKWAEERGYGKYVTNKYSPEQATDENGNEIPWYWLAGGFAVGGVTGALSAGGLGYLTGTGGVTGSTITNPFGFIPDVLQLGGFGFAGFCAMVLILKAVFSGTDLGELMSGAGEIIPL